jgi:hypothetical protein
MTSPFARLRDFLGQKMRMSHIYQPLMLETLLRNRGTARVRDIAAAILAHDESQLDYYEEIVKRMPGKVLASHGIVKREKGSYHLDDDVASAATGRSIPRFVRSKSVIPCRASTSRPGTPNRHPGKGARVR